MINNQVFEFGQNGFIKMLLMMTPEEKQMIKDMADEAMNFCLYDSDTFSQEEIDVWMKKQEERFK